MIEINNKITIIQIIITNQIIIMKITQDHQELRIITNLDNIIIIIIEIKVKDKILEDKIKQDNIMEDSNIMEDNNIMEDSNIMEDNNIMGDSNTMEEIQDSIAEDNNIMEVKIHKIIDIKKDRMKNKLICRKIKITHKM